MATKKAPANGVIRHESGSARHIRAGAVIPAGWTFDDGGKAAPKTGPAENTQAAGPSETAGIPGSGKPPAGSETDPVALTAADEPTEPAAEADAVAPEEPTEENTAPDEPPAAGKKKETKPS